ncbi:IgGFc-binding protein-like [Discoglossus pictus]
MSMRNARLDPESISVRRTGAAEKEKMVNNIRSQLPVSLMDGMLNMFQSGNSVLLQYGNDFQLSYDWNHVLRVELTRRYAGHVCGMCGNYNQNPGDDFQTSNGSQTSDVVAFGASWKVPNNDTLCWDDCHGPCLKCPPDQAQQYTTDDYCGLLGKADGPFSACHPLINPKTNLENCVYDVCLSGGNRKISCDALKEYADACQRGRAGIAQWRETAKCPLQCPPNSVYKLCGRACPATCQDPEATSTCTEPCVETCECNPGFLLIKGQCLPRDSCGCFYEGRSFASNETFWGDNNCQQRCVCNGKTQIVECKDSPCKVGEICAIKDGLQDCYPTKYGTCIASGDPHFKTYDAVRYDFMGTCVYQLSALCDKESGLTDFQVLVQNENRGNTKVSYTTTVIIIFLGIEIEISQKIPNKVKVNGRLINLPHSPSDGSYSLYRNPNSAVVSTSFGFILTFDWSSVLTLTIPSTYGGKVCGLCGNFNGNGNDDLIPRGETTATPTAAIFAQSWNVTDCNKVVITDPVCDGLKELEERQRDEGTECGIVLHPQGPFRDCHKLVNPEGYFKNCVYDYCAIGPRQAILCQELGSYVQACQAAGGTVHPWRSEKFCSRSCPSHSHYELCAYGCPVTCNGITSPAGCDSSCREGCVCDDGLILSGGTCVRQSECGCVDNNGVYYSLGESYYVGEKCTQKCTCSTAGGSPSCSSSSCSTNEECRIKNGVLSCFPVGSAICTATSGTHYGTLDGKAYSHQGRCSYILAQSCAESSEGKMTEFRVTTDIGKFGSSSSVIKSMTLEIYGQKLTLRQKGITEVNGVDLRLPVTLLSGKVRAECSGMGIVILVDIGLMLFYDLSGHATVTVPSNYKNRICGMCGNYNGNPDDDVGPMPNDIIALGEKWKIPAAGESCDPGCGGTDNPCPTCEDAKSAIFSQDNYCGKLSAATGPFAKCHSTVDPAIHVKNCISDLCQSNGDRTKVCNNAVAYATACKEAGITDIHWRSEEFCAVQCPPNSKYTTCVNLCTSSCAALTDPHKCDDGCMEGCQCDDGYLFDGEHCIPTKECGCFENGRYYKHMETALNDDCTQACTCNANLGLSCHNMSCAEDERCQIEDGVRSCVSTDPCKSKTCHVKETCKAQDGKAVCVPDYMGTCWAWGDPHLNTYDGKAFDFQGTCSYVLSEYTGDDPTLPQFKVVIKNNNRGNQAVSYVKMVTIYIYNKQITIQTGEFGKVQVDGVLSNLPVYLEDMNVTKSGFTATVETKFGMTVSYDWNWHVIATLPSSYYDKVSGLCGNFNGNPDDDQRAPNKTQIDSITEWGSSWKVYDRDPFCFDYCPGVCPTCDESEKNLYGGDEQCGLIFKADGPFRECHSRIKPNKFFDSCLYDVCMNDGAKNMLCQALEAYACTCRKESVRIHDWRTPSGCPKPCYKNSHYEACGSACPATCSDRNAPSSCTKPCVETCECDDGFVFSVDKCVPNSSCGCHYEGQYYEPNQEFWDNDKCTERCKCDPSLGMVVCQQTSCKSSEMCKVVNGILGCYPTTYTTCIASGDPHCISFDGQKFDFMGTCTYILVESNTNDFTLTNFSVHVKNDHRGNKAVSYTRDVTLKVYNMDITLSWTHQEKIKVNGIFTELPFYYRGSQIMAYTSGGQIIIKTDSDITMSFDGNSYVQVIVPSTYAGAVNGLCGNNNQDPSDDFTIGDGKIAQTAEELSNYWKVGDCTENPPCLNCPTCSNEQKDLYGGDQFCGIITKANGPFGQCHSIVDPKTYFDDCVFDVCHYPGHQSAMCNIIAPYVSECQRQGAEIKEWRTPLFCPMVCTQNSHYKLCGDGCPSTCHGFAAPPSCKASCTEGCYCDNGFMLSGKSCVPMSQCGCVFEDTYYKVGDEFYTEQCQQKCKCVNTADITCQSNTCGVNEECKVMQGIEGCHAKELGNCVAWGNSHYLTFDSNIYYFQGPCKYTLVNASTDSISFSIEIEHDPNGSGSNSVTVHVFGKTFQLERGRSWSILVNGERYNLPYNDGYIWANQEGSNLILHSNFGLKILNGHSYYTSVWVPSSFAGKTQGLCGNYNKDKSDDFHLPNGSIITDPAIFGAFWTVAGDGSSCLGCIDGSCPVCEDAGNARSLSNCGIMEDPEGPFKDCHALVPHKRFVDNCVYDVCSGQGGEEALCMSLEAYAVECQNMGGKIGAWRNTKCPLSCPPNSHYEQCTHTCGITCAGMFSPSTCTDRCFEGCECDPGYVFDGDTCVPVNQCGCIYNGRYLQTNESVMSEDCGQLCTCQSGSVSCKDLSCSTAEICQLRNGHRGCYPRDAECTIHADYTRGVFITFDGVFGDFPSGGTFVMASSCSADSDRPFLVAVDDQYCSRDIRRRSLHVFTPAGLIDINIKINIHSGGTFWFNGREMTVPNEVGDGTVKITGTEKETTIEIVELLTAVIDISGNVKLIAKENIAGTICGACGNFNGEGSDDLQLKNGQKSSNIIYTVRSWTANFFSTCMD